MYMSVILERTCSLVDMRTVDNASQDWSSVALCVCESVIGCMAECLKTCRQTDMLITILNNHTCYSKYTIKNGLLDDITQLPQQYSCPLLRSQHIKS